VAEVTQRAFDVKYHPAHVRRILNELGWTPPKTNPAGETTQRRSNTAAGPFFTIAG